MKKTSLLTKIRYIGTAFALIIVCIGLVRLIIARSTNDDVELDLENFSVENITDEEIVNVPNCYRAFNTGRKSSGKGSGILELEYDDSDHDSVTFHAKKVIGIVTVSATQVTDGKLQLNIQSKLGKGVAKIVILKDEEIIEYTDLTDELNVEYAVEGKHRFYVRLICENAEVEISVDRSIEKSG